MKYEINKEILDYEKYIDELWTFEVEHQMLSSDLYIKFSDKFDFFNYMIRKKEYKQLINKQSTLNEHIEYIYKQINIAL